VGRGLLGRGRPVHVGCVAAAAEGYLISDQGLLNVALGSRHVADYHELVARVTSGDETLLHDQMLMGAAVVRYLSSASGVSVEVLAIPDPEIERAAGFVPTC
jgi:hypothetical protein